MERWKVGVIILFILGAGVVIFLVHYFAALPPEAYQTTPNESNLNLIDDSELSPPTNQSDPVIPFVPVIPTAEIMAPENKYEVLKSQTVDLIQQVNSQKRYLLLQASENDPLSRAKRYYTSQIVSDPSDPTRHTTTLITGDLSDYKTEVVGTPSSPAGKPWSFRVFTEPGPARRASQSELRSSGPARRASQSELRSSGPGRIQWCVWTQARNNPNFVIRQGMDCQNTPQLGELLVYTFWAPDQLAPEITWVRVERNDSDPEQTRYRLRPANQPLESDWIPQDKILTPSVTWGY